MRTKTVLLCLALAAPVAGQVPWDTPMLLAPGSPGGIGVFLFDPGSAGGLGVMGSWRGAPAPAGIGVRVGLGNDAFDQFSVFAGLDVSGTLFEATEEVPVGGIWVLGAGVAVGQDAVVSFPAGLSFGTDLRSEGVLFRPYVTPRVSLDVRSGPGDQLDLAAAVDLGLDLSFAPGWMIRFAASVGDRRTVAIGLAFPNVSLGR